MHPEHPPAVTRRLIDTWLPTLDAEGATPAALLAVSHADPGRVLVCTPQGTSLVNLRALLTHCLREVDQIEADQAARLTDVVPPGCVRVEPAAG